MSGTYRCSLEPFGDATVCRSRKIQGRSSRVTSSGISERLHCYGAIPTVFTSLNDTLIVISHRRRHDYPRRLTGALARIKSGAFNIALFRHLPSPSTISERRPFIPRSRRPRPNHIARAIGKRAPSDASATPACMRNSPVAVKWTARSHRKPSPSDPGVSPCGHSAFEADGWAVSTAKPSLGAETCAAGLRLAAGRSFEHSPPSLAHAQRTKPYALGWAGKATVHLSQR